MCGQEKVAVIKKWPCYRGGRSNNFYNNVKILIPNITQLPVNVLIDELMNTSNYYITLQVKKYISACFDFRDDLLTR